MPDTRTSTVALLVQVEQQLDMIDAGLMSSAPSGLVQASSDVRQSAIAFARVLEAALSAEVLDYAFRSRIETVAQRLASQREAVARRSVVVDRALASIFRPRTDVTYSMSGEHRVFAAANQAAMSPH